MIDDNIKDRLEPEFLPGESLLWTGRPQRFVMDRFAVFLGLAISIGVFSSAVYYQHSADVWGPWSVLAAMLLAHSLYPNFEKYAVSNKFIYITRSWPLIASAKVRRTDIESVQKFSGVFGSGISIVEHTKFPSFWPFLKGSNMSFAFGFWERHWYLIYGHRETDHLHKILTGAQP